MTSCFKGPAPKDSFFYDLSFKPFSQYAQKTEIFLPHSTKVINYNTSAALLVDLNEKKIRNRFFEAHTDGITHVMTKGLYQRELWLITVNYMVDSI